MGSNRGLRRRRPLRMLIVAVSVVLTGCAARPGGQVGPSVAQLPVLGPVATVFDGDLGDPFVLKDPTGSSYVTFGTGTPPDRIPTASSQDLVQWRQGPDALPRLPRWAEPDPGFALTWAPAVLAVPGAFVMYVTVPDAASGQPCIAAATSRALDGPYVDALGHPLVCQPRLGGSIDPSVSRAADGSLTLLWKTNGVCCTSGSTIWAQPLLPGGLALSGTAHPLLSASQAWQRGIVEEPAVVPASRGGWWLFYSGDGYDQPGYSVGLAWCRSLEQSCRETSDRPFLVTKGTQRSPGGLETFRGPDGSWRAVFDTWSRPTRNGRYYCCRALDIAPLNNL